MTNVSHHHSYTCMAIGAQVMSMAVPVLFYIHSGAYSFGNPQVWPFDHWVHQSPNVVIVAVYYRLASFGFLSAPEFASEGVADLNVGFYDQIEALKWVQNHIDAFGGDPQQVTIDGQSAGGSSVELHLLAGQSQGLFSQAIGQSVYRTPLQTLDQMKVCLVFRWLPCPRSCTCISMLMS